MKSKGLQEKWAAEG